VTRDHRAWAMPRLWYPWIWVSFGAAGMTILRLLPIALLAASCAGSAPPKMGDGSADDSRVASDGKPADAVAPGDSQHPDQLVPTQDLGPGCGPHNCSGCCTPGLVCGAGTSDTACGSKGAPCVNCTAIPNSTCSGGACTNCAPACAGVVCGASDGCGGACQPGSGCCEPDCASKLCGEGDGCGGTCSAGSGCTPPCVEQADADTLLLYTFSGSGTTVTDVTGAHPGTLVGSGAKRVAGKAGCGQALELSATTPVSHVLVDDAADWDLSTGSVDLWLTFDQPAGASEGIFSRDASGQTNPGHLTLMRLCNGSLMIRLQDTVDSFVQCSEPVSDKTWHHVGVNFGGNGGLKLYVDGKLAARTTDIVCGTSTTSCGSSTSNGIAGNDNPWVVGGSIWTSSEGTADPVTLPLNGKVDSFRISKVRRTF
jgi:hypothetical protein